MKKWLYLIVPTILLAIFLFFYLAFEKELEKKEADEKAKKEAVAKAEADKKAESERIARESAAKKAAERKAEEEKKEADRVAKQKAEDERIKNATDGYNAEIAANTKQATDLEAKLESLRNAREKANREDFDQAKRVELAKVEKRSAEMEIQRITEQISKRASDSTLVRPPAVPAPAGGTN